VHLLEFKLLIRSTENLTSFTEVTKKQKRKKKPIEDTYPTVTRSVRTIAPFRSKPYNNVGYVALIVMMNVNLLSGLQVFEVLFYFNNLRL